MLRSLWRKGNPSALLVGMKTGAATVEKVWNFLRKLKMGLPFDPAIQLLASYPKNPETPIQKNLCTSMIIAVLFTIAQRWKQPKCPSSNECIQKLWYIYRMEFYTAKRKKELIPFGTASVSYTHLTLPTNNPWCRSRWSPYH